MSSSMPKHQYTRPVVVSSMDDAGLAQPLERVQLSSVGNYSEAWLQHLLHRHPTLLPVSEIESGLGQLIPVGMELPTPVGYVDNLYVTLEGNLVVVECKLWRNPEARRKVLAQIIDYAQGMSTWSYEEFDLAISKCIGSDKKSLRKTLLEVVRAGPAEHSNEVDEATFIDAVQRNLRLGRMLLLVVGDGIREDAERLAEYVQRHAGFHFTLGLIEAAIYRLPGDQLLVQPRVLARTLNIERAVITISGGMAVTTPSGTQGSRSEKARAVSLSEESYFERLQVASADTQQQRSNSFS